MTLKDVAFAGRTLRKSPTSHISAKSLWLSEGASMFTLAMHFSVPAPSANGPYAPIAIPQKGRHTGSYSPHVR
jgi:hypothetical protein